MVSPAVHFIGFRGEEFWSAVKVWGRPGFIHMRWDRRARREIADGDTLVFARGYAGQPPSQINAPDLIEDDRETGEPVRR